MKVGDRVKVVPGATRWMKMNGYWAQYIKDDIDRMEGTIVEDYTILPGDDSHFAVDLGFEYDVGINGDWLLPV